VNAVLVASGIVEVDDEAEDDSKDSAEDGGANGIEDGDNEEGDCEVEEVTTSVVLDCIVLDRDERMPTLTPNGAVADALALV